MVDIVVVTYTHKDSIAMNLFFKQNVMWYKSEYKSHEYS